MLFATLENAIRASRLRLLFRSEHLGFVYCSDQSISASSIVSTICSAHLEDRAMIVVVACKYSWRSTLTSPVILVIACAADLVVEALGDCQETCYQMVMIRVLPDIDMRAPAQPLAARQGSPAFGCCFLPAFRPCMTSPNTYRGLHYNQLGSVHLLLERHCARIKFPCTALAYSALMRTGQLYTFVIRGRSLKRGCVNPVRIRTTVFLDISRFQQQQTSYP